MRSITVHEPEWDDDDRAAVFAFDEARSTTCTGCGFPLEETTDIGREDLYDAHLTVCHACSTAERVVNAHREGGGDMAGVRVQYRERPPYEPQGAPQP